VQARALLLLFIRVINFRTPLRRVATRRQNWIYFEDRARASRKSKAVSLARIDSSICRIEWRLSIDRAYKRGNHFRGATILRE